MHGVAAFPESNPASKFAELSVVRLVRTVKVGPRAMPSGTLGTVVGCYANGIGYEVEFAEPFHTIVTLVESDLVTAY